MSFRIHSSAQGLGGTSTESTSHTSSAASSITRFDLAGVTELVLGPQIIVSSGWMIFTNASTPVTVRFPTAAVLSRYFTVSETGFFQTFNTINKSGHPLTFVTADGVIHDGQLALAIPNMDVTKVNMFLENLTPGLEQIRCVNGRF